MSLVSKSFLIRQFFRKILSNSIFRIIFEENYGLNSGGFSVEQEVRSGLLAIPGVHCLNFGEKILRILHVFFF